MVGYLRLFEESELTYLSFDQYSGARFLLGFLSVGAHYGVLMLAIEILFSVVIQLNSTMFNL